MQAVAERARQFGHQQCKQTEADRARPLHCAPDALCSLPMARPCQHTTQLAGPLLGEWMAGHRGGDAPVGADRPEPWPISPSYISPRGSTGVVGAYGLEPLTGFVRPLTTPVTWPAHSQRIAAAWSKQAPVGKQAAGRVGRKGLASAAERRRPGACRWWAGRQHATQQQQRTQPHAHSQSGGRRGRRAPGCEFPLSL